MVDSILQPGVDARIKFGNLTNKVVGGFRFDDQKVLSPRVDELPKMALKMDSGIDMKSIIDKIWPDFSFGSLVDGEGRKKTIRASKRSKRLARKRFPY